MSDSDSLEGHPPQPLSFRGRELELNLLLQVMCCWEKDILGSHQNGQTFIPLADVLPAVWVTGSPASPRGPFSSTSHLAATGNCLLSFLKKSPSFKHIIFFFFIHYYYRMTASLKAWGFVCFSPALPSAWFSVPYWQSLCLFACPPHTPPPHTLQVSLWFLWLMLLRWSVLAKA